MKVEGSGKEIQAIRFLHRGSGLEFQHIPPKEFMYMSDTEPTETPLIRFDDIYEIDAMIAMLESFKGVCKSSLGLWRRGGASYGSGTEI